jgi:hypothetical protein
MKRQGHITTNYRDELKAKADQWDADQKAKADLAAKQSDPRYINAIQHGKFSIISTKSGGLDFADERRAALEQLESDGDITEYWRAQKAIDEQQYKIWDEKSAAKRADAQTLENEAQEIEKQKDA